MSKNKKNISIYEAKTSFSKLIQRVLSGEEIIISRRNNPVAKLISCNDNTKVKLERFKGKVKIADDFNEPLDDFNEYIK